MYQRYRTLILGKFFHQIKLTFLYFLPNSSLVPKLRVSLSYPNAFASRCHSALYIRFLAEYPLLLKVKSFIEIAASNQQLSALTRYLPWKSAFCRAAASSSLNASAISSLTAISFCLAHSNELSIFSSLKTIPLSPSFP